MFQISKAARPNIRSAEASESASDPPSASSKPSQEALKTPQMRAPAERVVLDINQRGMEKPSTSEDGVVECSFQDAVYALFKG
mmetsp:Transcript_27742/g.60347  ORF Transcript_27742/g.60347 Transcript_27742/m.60347 type:complete len:83 (+) Transcript_27742:1745-1993(+)